MCLDFKTPMRLFQSMLKLIKVGYLEIVYAFVGIIQVVLILNQALLVILTAVNPPPC